MGRMMSVAVRASGAVAGELDDGRTKRPFLREAMVSASSSPSSYSCFICGVDVR